MNDTSLLEIFLVATPGLEQALLVEAGNNGFRKPKLTDGGVTIKGDWTDVWRANLVLRGASRILVRLGQFRVQHLSQLDKLARQFPWSETLRANVAVRVDVTCRKSKIYHQKAAAERIERALVEEMGITIDPDAEVCIKARIMQDVCTISVDSSGEGLHKRGHKEALNKAPLRETLAALLLYECGYKGAEPVLDPMCGSGTFVLEAAEIATRLAPGRSRGFAFEKLATFDSEIWQEVKARYPLKAPTVSFFGFDRDAGAIEKAMANSLRAGISDYCHFKVQPISELSAPQGQTGLVIINPPYGVRLGDVKKLMPLYQKTGQVLARHFKGWRVGLATTSGKLAQATGLPFEGKPLGFSHGGLKVYLYRTAVLD